MPQWWKLPPNNLHTKNREHFVQVLPQHPPKIAKFSKKRTGKFLARRQHFQIGWLGGENHAPQSKLAHHRGQIRFKFEGPDTNQAQVALQNEKIAPSQWVCRRGGENEGGFGEVQWGEGFVRKVPLAWGVRGLDWREKRPFVYFLEALSIHEGAIAWKFGQNSLDGGLEALLRGKNCGGSAKKGLQEWLFPVFRRGGAGGGRGGRNCAEGIFRCWE